MKLDIGPRSKFSGFKGKHKNLTFVVTITLVKQSTVFYKVTEEQSDNKTKKRTE